MSRPPVGRAHRAPRRAPVPRLVAAVHTAAAALTLAAVGWTAATGVAGWGAALAFGAVIALGEAGRVPRLPYGAHGADREAAPLATAGALAYALLGPALLGPARHGVAQVVAVAVLAALAGALPHTVPYARSYRRAGARGRLPEDPGAPGRPGAPGPRATAPERTPHGPGSGREEEALTHPLPAGDGAPPPARAAGGWVGDAAARRVLTVAFAATCCQPLGDGRLLAGPAYALGLLLVLALTALCDAALAAGLAAARAGRPFPPALRDEVRALAGIGSAVCAGGVVMALAVGAAGLWALPVVGLPLLLTQVSLRGQAAVRATYRQTIGSLSRATEVGGHTPAGHARRVSELATAVGRELGLAARHLVLLEYAALMHDIGQLSLVDPVPRGATEPLDGARQREIAALGGEVVRRTGAPAEVARIVERQAHPYREQPLAGRIVRAVNAYEDLTGEPAPLDRRLAAMERLRLATARDYDPRVVEALTRVLARHSAGTWLDARRDGKESGEGTRSTGSGGPHGPPRSRAGNRDRYPC